MRKKNLFGKASAVALTAMVTVTSPAMTGAMNVHAEGVENNLSEGDGNAPAESTSAPVAESAPAAETAPTPATAPAPVAEPAPAPEAPTQVEAPAPTVDPVAESIAEAAPSVETPSEVPALVQQGEIPAQPDAPVEEGTSSVPAAPADLNLPADNAETTTPPATDATAEDPIVGTPVLDATMPTDETIADPTAAPVDATVDQTGVILAAATSATTESGSETPSEIKTPEAEVTSTTKGATSDSTPAADITEEATTAADPAAPLATETAPVDENDEPKSTQGDTAPGETAISSTGAKKRMSAPAKAPAKAPEAKYDEAKKDAVTGDTKDKTTEDEKTPEADPEDKKDVSSGEENQSDKDGLGVGISGMGLVKNGELKPVEGETDSKGRQKYATSVEGVYCYFDTEPDEATKKFAITFEVDDSVDTEVAIPVSEAAITLLNQWMTDYTNNKRKIYPLVPGDYNGFDVTVITSNDQKHTFAYKDGSLIVSTQDCSDRNDLTEFTGADGQLIPYPFVGAIPSSEPIQKLLGKSGKITLIDILKMNQKLKDKGYKGETPLTDYLLDYYSDDFRKEDDSKYTSFSELALEHPNVVFMMQGGNANPLYTVNKDTWDKIKTTYSDEYKKLADIGAIQVTHESEDKLSLEVKWPEKMLAEASYNLFYRDLLAMAFGKYDYDSFQRLMNGAGTTSEARSIGIMDYMENLNGLWDETNNEYFKALNAIGAYGSDKLAYEFWIGLNGPLMNNSYQDYVLSFGHSITLEQLDGGIQIEKVDENNNLIPAEANFNLYYLTSVDGNDTKYYLTGYKDGIPEFGTNADDAYVILTIDGKADVQYLMPREYYLKEVKAPEGYELSEDEIKVLVEKGKIAEVKVINKVIVIPDPDPEPEPEPDPTPEPTPEPVPPTPIPPVPTPIPPTEEIPTIVPVDDAGVLGAARTEDPIETIAATVPKTIPEKGMVLGATRNSKTGDEADMNVLGMTAGTAMLGLFAWIMANRKRRQWR